MIPGDNPAVEVHQASGEEFCATWAAPGWDLYWRETHDPATDPPFVFVAHIVDAPKSQAGLTFQPTGDGALVFSYYDGTITRRLYSRHQGLHWTTT